MSTTDTTHPSFILKPVPCQHQALQADAALQASAKALDTIALRANT